MYSPGASFSNHSRINFKKKKLASLFVKLLVSTLRLCLHCRSSRYRKYEMQPHPTFLRPRNALTGLHPPVTVSSGGTPPREPPHAVYNVAAPLIRSSVEGQNSAPAIGSASSRQSFPLATTAAFKVL